MKWRDEWRWLVGVSVVFAVVFFLPVGAPRFDRAVLEALHLVKWYAREHVLLCLLPAFFIAGAITVFVSQTAVMKYLGAGANQVLAYAVASVSGTVLAVCSCTVLPLFAGIYRRGAGLGPATAFLYAGPAINVLAIILTARVLGVELGVARAVGAIAFSVVIGLIMQALYRREEQVRVTMAPIVPAVTPVHGLGQEVTYFASMIGILVFANWAPPATPWGVWSVVFAYKWWMTAVLATTLAVILARWFRLPEIEEWLSATWEYAKQITPLLLGGVLLAGLLLGRPGHAGLIPSEWVASAVGGNSLGANLFAALAGTFMYFATLTEVPIVQGMMGSGMGEGPALALLLAGPALSLPSMLVLRSILGTAKTAVYVSLVVLMATISGMLFGAWSYAS